ncbi:MAG TPA: hypothetical protein QGH03_01575 [Candidatus Paceibacterota bacterium]|nr:hypothetical protein [Candidatus Paceibacterota bacterium]HJN62901.1 hypothetical protein [Candidatus Paceibacterota bacterium]
MKNFFIKKLMKSRMKDVPDEQIDAALGIFEKNPELFKKIAEEIKKEVEGGKDQMTASMEVMGRYQEELKNLNN